jgi:predicted ATPase
MTVFVGRAAELAGLAEIAGAPLAGDVAAAVVVGEPGSGKSRLLAEAAARAEATTQFRVVGYEPEQQVPLAAAADLLRALTETTPTDGGSRRSCSTNPRRTHRYSSRCESSRPHTAPSGG